MYYALAWLQILISLTVITAEGNAGSLAKQWTLAGAMTTSALPATIYAIQNTLIQLAYRHLDYLTFSMLNQTKRLFTALFNFLFLGYVHSAPCILQYFLHFRKEES